MERDYVILLDILIAAQRIQLFTAELGEATFETSLKDQSAVMWQIAIIGEATRRLSQAFRNAHPEIPWQSMAGSAAN